MDDVKSETSCSINKTDFKTFNGFNVFMLFAKWYCKSSIPLPKYYYFYSLHKKWSFYINYKFKFFKGEMFVLKKCKKVVIYRILI